MTRERIEDYREIVLPFLSRTLLKTNYENMGKSDAEEFERDFNEILDLAIKAIEQEPKTGHWIAYEVRLPDRTILNYRCSVCGRKLIGYSTETLSEAPFCHCGARMVESQESEV